MNSLLAYKIYSKISSLGYDIKQVHTPVFIENEEIALELESDNSDITATIVSPKVLDIIVPELLKKQITHILSADYTITKDIPRNVRTLRVKVRGRFGEEK